MIKRKKKILQKAVQLITSEISIKIYTKKSSRKSQYHQKWILKALCYILVYLTSSELKQEGIGQATVKLSSPHKILLNLFGISI